MSIISNEPGIDRKRLLQWTLAWAGLSASWILNDGADASMELELAAIIQNELNA